MVVNQQIDAVFTWVDGSDPAFLLSKAQHAALWSTGTPPGWEKRSSYTGEAERRDRPVPASHSFARFRDKDELRFALRSIHQNAPWIRRIFIVTNGQVPAWLELNHPRLAIVPHDRLFVDRQCLPTFNSNAIESTIHRIPGLSSNFIYFNDDFFIGRPVTPADFIDAEGRHRLFVESTRKMPRDMTDRSTIAHSWAFNNALLNDRVGPSMSRLMFAHTPQMYNKHVLAEIDLVWHEHFERTRRNRFRTAFDAAFRLLYTYYVGEGKRQLISQEDSKAFGQITPVSSESYAFIKVGDPTSDFREAMAHTERNQPTFFCVNDELPDHSSLDDEEAMRALTQSFLLRFFPNPSPFERAIEASAEQSETPRATRARQLPILAGEPFVFGADGPQEVGREWHESEEAGLWSTGPHAELRMRIDPHSIRDGFEVRCVARVLGCELPGGRLLKISVALGRENNSTLTSEFRLTSDDYLVLSCPAPEIPAGWNGELSLAFDRLIAPRPSDVGFPEDRRILSICIKQIAVVPQQAEASTTPGARGTSTQVPVSQRRARSPSVAAKVSGG